MINCGPAPFAYAAACPDFSVFGLLADLEVEQTMLRAANKENAKLRERAEKANRIKTE